MGERLFKPQDAHKLEDPKRQIWLPVADVIRALAIRSGMRVADVGVGTGYFAIPMAQAVGPNGRIYAIDLQAEMLTMLRQKLERPDAPRNIDLVQGAASKTSLASKCADVVFIANVWHELDDHEAALQEAARILVPGGTLALLDWRPDKNSPPGPPPDHRLPENDVVQFLTKHNWTTAPPVNIGHYSSRRTQSSHSLLNTTGEQTHFYQGHSSFRSPTEHKNEPCWGEGVFHRPTSRGRRRGSLFRFVNDLQNRFFDRSRNASNSRVRIETSKRRRSHGADESLAVFGVNSDRARQ